MRLQFVLVRAAPNPWAGLEGARPFGLGSRGAHVCAVTDQPAARLDAVRVWLSSHCPSARASVADVCVQVTPPSFLPVGQP